MSFERNLEHLRNAFGSDADMIMRGLSVATRELDTSEALTVVLETMDAHRTDRPMNDLQRQVAEVMWPEKAGPVDDVATPSLATLTRDVHTSLGLFPAGTTVRVVDRMEDGHVLVAVLDVNQTVFPIAEDALKPVES